MVITRFGIWSLFTIVFKGFFNFNKGRSVARCPEPRYLINKLIKQQEQIYHLQL